MYGTDWMLLDFEPYNGSYYQKMKDYFGDLLGNGVDLNAFLAKNAVTFLGLHAGAETRKRLNDFFRRNRQEPLNFDEYLVS